MELLIQSITYPVRGRGRFRDKIVYLKNVMSLNNGQSLRSVRPRPASNGMRVLIGTPVHECKDYAMERWLESVSKLDYPFDLLLVDNSDSPKYVDKLHKYCKKHGITNYKLVHIDVNQDAVLDERLAQSREIIRQEILDKNYDAWCSLECDVIAPPDALSKLVGLIEDYWMVNHVYPNRNDSHQINEQLGITLVKRRMLKKYSFINGYGYVNPLRPDCWFGSDVWFIRQVDTSNTGKRINVGGIIKPIYHLNLNG